MPSFTLIKQVTYVADRDALVDPVDDPAWKLDLDIQTANEAPIKPFLVEGYASFVDHDLNTVTWDSDRFRYLRTLRRDELAGVTEDQPSYSSGLKKGYHRYRVGTLEAYFESYDLAKINYEASLAVLNSYLLEEAGTTTPVTLAVHSANSRVTETSVLYRLDRVRFLPKGGSGEYTLSTDFPADVSISGLVLRVLGVPAGNSLTVTATDSLGGTAALVFSVIEAPALGSASPVVI